MIMGANDAKQNQRDDKRRKAEETRKRRSNTVTGGTPADWASCDGALLARAVGAIARMGGALRLGYTRDGGAYAVGIYGDGEPFTEYVPPSDDIEVYLKGIIEDYE
jgi:hypothetical protein